LNYVIWSRIHKTAFVRNNTVSFGLYDAVECFNGGAEKKNGVLNIIGESVSKSVNAMKRIHTERIRKTNRNSEHHKRKKKNHKGSAKKIKRVQVIQNMVQVIQNMVLEIIKCESVSLFTVIFSDVKL